MLEVTAEAEDIRLTSFEAMSSVMQIQETEFVSDSMVRLHVTPTISSGQAIELLRVHYVDETSNREEKIAELKIGFSTSKDYRFILIYYIFFVWSIWSIYHIWEFR